jgi:cell division protein FtsL
MKRPLEHRLIPAPTLVITVVALAIVGVLYANARNRQNAIRAEVAQIERRINSNKQMKTGLAHEYEDLLERKSLMERVASRHIDLRKTPVADIRVIPHLEPPEQVNPVEVIDDGHGAP